MGSRIRENPEHLYICFCEIVIPNDKESRAWLLWKHPEDFADEELLKSVPDFACPCEFINDAVQHFSFVLTSLDSKWTYGFCRHAPGAQTLFVILSFLPWHETFYRALNQISDLTNDLQSGLLSRFLDTLYSSPIPEPGSQLHLLYGIREFQAPCPNHLKLPSIPDNRNLTEYFNAVDARNMMVIFASMLHERRIVVTSKKLSRLSACVQAANSLIYPMHWQHIFIPVLPKHLLDYISAPMPFLIGVPSVTMAAVKQSELGEVVILDADNNRIKTPFKDFETLPLEVVSSLKRRLKNPNLMLGDGVARAFMRALVHLIGGYRDALKMAIGEKISFDQEAFIKSRPPTIQPFLEAMLHLQLFRQFIDDRLEMLNSGIGFSDEFEEEINSYQVHASTRLKNQYKEWVGTMKKEGGIFLKNVKSKTNPAVKSAYKSVKDKSRKAYKDIRSKIQEIQKHPSQPDLTYQKTVNKPRSAPSSPTLQKSAFDFSARRSYLPEVKNKHGPLDSINLTNSVSVAGIRRYKMLTVDEISVGSDESLSDNDDNTDIQPISMDLMGDLQDYIFRKCSTSSEGPDVCVNGDATLIKAEKECDPLESTPFGFEDSFTNVNDNDVFLPPVPVPPPRTKRKLASTKVVKEFVEVKKEEPLIKLDSFDDDSMFDPLIDKDSKNPSLVVQERKSAMNDSVAELKQKIQNLNAPQTQTYFPVTSTFSAFPVQNNACQNAVPFYGVPGIVNIAPLSQNAHVLQAHDYRPPLPPKISTRKISKNDRDLLSDYGLATSPIFKGAVLQSPENPPSENCQDSSIFKDHATDVNKLCNNRSTWQKFT